MAWYAVRSKPCAEIMAGANIGRSGIQYFIPFIRNTHGKTVPLFSRYLFASANRLEELAPVHRARGVVGIVGPSMHQPPVRAGLIEGLIELQQQRGGYVVDELQPPSEPLRIGESVRITSGVWSGFVTELLAVRGNTALLMVMLFGHEREVHVRLDRLERAA